MRPGVRTHPGERQFTEGFFFFFFYVNCLDCPSVQNSVSGTAEQQDTAGRFTLHLLPPLPIVQPAGRYERQKLELLRNRKRPACLSVFQRKPGAEACDV